MTEDERLELDRPATIPMAHVETTPRMTEDEWRKSDDVLRMIKALWESYRGDEATLERKLHRYYLACCRAIWKLLPDEGSRRGVEVAEQYLEGRATAEDLDSIDWHSEASAFLFDYSVEDDPAVRLYVEQVRAIPEVEIRTMIHQSEVIAGIPTRQLLTQAAYFASFSIRPPFKWNSLSNAHLPFLSPSLLREEFSLVWRPR